MVRSFRLWSSTVDPVLLAFLEEMNVNNQVIVKESSEEKEIGRTFIVDRSGITITSPYTIFSMDGPGLLEYVVIICDSPGFSVDIYYDDKLLPISYDSASSISQDIPDMAAYKNDVGYLIAYRNIYCKKELSITVVPENKIKILVGKIKYHSFQTNMTGSQ